MASSNRQAANEFKVERATLANIPLLIGLAGGTGSGKTYTGMELATGLAGGKPFAVIDTENGRARHYANDFTFDRLELTAPFRPERYQDAILQLDAAGYPVIVVDSMSHEWAGDGGILDWQEEELDRMAGSDYQKREACKMAAWIKPKGAHKHMVTRLLQVRAHVILCFRAESKIEIVKQEGKWKAVPKASPVGLDGWLPICEKNLPFELTCSFLLTADAPGVPKPIKLQKQHRPYFDLAQPIVRSSGQQLAAWAAGGAPPPATTTTATTSAPTVAEYTACTDAAAFAVLERRRGEHWKAMPGAQKTALKAASDAAAARISAPATASTMHAAFDEQKAEQLVRGSTTRKELEDNVAGINTLLRGAETPLNVDAAIAEMRETLKE